MAFKLKLQQHFSNSSSRYRTNLRAFTPLLIGSIAMVAATAGHAYPPLQFAPLVSKSFAPSVVSVGGTSQMTIALTNPNSGNMFGVQFSDLYPSGIANAPVTPVVANTCAGSLNVPAGGSSVSLSNVAIHAKTSCHVIVNVVGTLAGVAVNQTGPVVAGNAPSGPSASAALAVTASQLLNAPLVTKGFAPSVVQIGGITQMAITLNNPNPQAITGVTFTDVYPPPGITNAPNSVVVSNSCGGVLAAVPNGTMASLTNGVILPNAICSVVINVVGTAIGPYTNHTGPVTSANAEESSDATATLTVTP